MIPSNCAWRVVVSMRSSKESSRFFSVEAVALPNLPQTFRGRERSKRGYAVDPLARPPPPVGSHQVSCVPAPLVPAQHLPARPPWLSAIGQRSVKSIAQRCCHGDRSAHRDCSAQSASRYAAVPATQHNSLRPRPSRLARGSNPRRVDPGVHSVCTRSCRCTRSAVVC